MCGIVGYTGGRPCRDLLLSGLRKLEYRGYDSAGLSLAVDGRVESVRAVGNLQKLTAVVDDPETGFSADATARATSGIGHTRWATHGEVTEDNAHPHTDCGGLIHVAVNGIIENYAELRDDLEAAGHRFTSETDAEVVAHLVEKHVSAADVSLSQAVRAAAGEMRGHFAFALLSRDQPGLLIGARRECPLIVGLGRDGNFVASAIPAFLSETRRVQVVGDGEIVEITPESTRFSTMEGEPVKRDEEEVTWDADAAEKGGYATFMLKEIHEQADALADTLAGRFTPSSEIDLSETGLSDADFRGLERIVVVGCGTAYHAGLIGRYAIGEWARLPVEMDIASEYRYRNPVVGPGDLVVGISQSGETADTLAAMRLSRERGAKVLALTNVLGSQATRDADGVLYTRAGLEISVAATKTLVAQAGAMYLLGLKLAAVRGTLGADDLGRLSSELRALPSKVERLLNECDTRVKAVARSVHEKNFFLYLGRNIGLPVALEGALKLKEISYIPTEAYAAGEMKHGPIALIDPDDPVVAVATRSPVLEKMLSNIAQVKARGARVIAIATEGDTAVEREAAHTIFVPETDWVLEALLAVIPLQLLAYYIARMRGLSVDQPRNLAKTVTVE